MPRAARDACGARTSRAEGSACRGPRRWRSGQGPGGGLQGDLEALSLSPPALVGPAAMGPSHGELLLRDCPKGPSGRCGRDDQRGGSGQRASSGARGRGAGPVHPSRLPSAQLPRRGWRGGEAGAFQAGCQARPQRHGPEASISTPSLQTVVGNGGHIVTRGCKSRDTFEKRLLGPEPKGNGHRPPHGPVRNTCWCPPTGGRASPGRPARATG